MAWRLSSNILSSCEIKPLAWLSYQPSSWLLLFCLQWWLLPLGEESDSRQSILQLDRVPLCPAPPRTHISAPLCPYQPQWMQQRVHATGFLKVVAAAFRISDCLLAVLPAPRLQIHPKVLSTHTVVGEGDWVGLSLRSVCFCKVWHKAWVAQQVDRITQWGPTALSPHVLRVRAPDSSLKLGNQR